MTSIITTIETDFDKVVAFVEKEGLALGTEALTILKSVGTSGASQLLTLLKESSIGTAVENAISAVDADGGDLLAAIPTIIADAASAIGTLKGANGSVISGLESFATNLGTALVTEMVADAKAIPDVGALITAVSALL